MTKFSVGDRVRVYSNTPTFDGKVTGMLPNGNIFVTEDGFYSCHNDSPFHPKQCRKLIKRKCREACKEEVSMTSLLAVKEEYKKFEKNYAAEKLREEIEQKHVNTYITTSIDELRKNFDRQEKRLDKLECEKGNWGVDEDGYVVSLHPAGMKIND